jgi:hypothetical protein
MIKTLHITSIIVGIFTVSLIVFGVVFGNQNSTESYKILQSPSAIEKFKTGSSKTSSQKNKQVSPLVTEAKSFALYLNPPPKPEPKQKPATKSKPKTKAKEPKTPVSAKFKLIGTAYYPLSPKTSMALVDQPGKGLSWIRQGEKVEHIILEQVKDGSIIIQEGNRTREMKTPARAEEQTIQKFMSSGITTSKNAGSKIGITPRVKGSLPSRAEPTVTPEQMAALQKVFSKVGASIEGGGEPNESEVQMLDEVFSSISQTRMNDNEANRLRALGKELEQSQELGNDDPNNDSNIRLESENNSDPNLDVNLAIDMIGPNSDPNINPNF